MRRSTRKKIKASLITTIMATLFSGGILLGGSEFTGFPTGPLLGALCWILLGVMAIYIKSLLIYPDDPGRCGREK